MARMTKPPAMAGVFLSQGAGVAGAPGGGVGCIGQDPPPCIGHGPAACIGQPCAAAVLSPAGRVPIIGHPAPGAFPACIWAHIGQGIVWVAPALSCAIGIAIPGIACIPPACIGQWAAIGVGVAGSGAGRAQAATPNNPATSTMARIDRSSTEGWLKGVRDRLRPP